MPHDKNGEKLEVGNEVVIRAKVKEIFEGADACNVIIEANEPPKEGESTRNCYTLTAKELEKVQEVPMATKMETNSLPIPEKISAQIESVFSYHKPKDEETAARCQEVRDAFKLQATYLAKKVPESRELSLALTHLELASMEAIAGIVRNQ